MEVTGPKGVRFVCCVLGYGGHWSQGCPIRLLCSGLWRALVPRVSDSFAVFWVMFVEACLCNVWVGSLSDLLSYACIFGSIALSSLRGGGAAGTTPLSVLPTHHPLSCTRYACFVHVCLAATCCVLAGCFAHVCLPIVVWACWMLVYGG